MRVLVTGATGAIGSTLCDSLLARGDEVIGLTRDPQRARSSNPTVRWYAWQATMERPPAEAFAEVDGVVNLIGEPIDQRWTEDSKRRIMESRATATRNLIQTLTALERQPSVLVSQSAIGYYGDRADALVDESSQPGEGFASEVSQAWEREAGKAADAGMRLVIVRTGLVLDPGTGLLGRMLTPFRLGVGGPIAGGRQYMSWIHLDDEIGILIWALDDPSVSGVVNAAAPNPVTNRELSRALGRVLGRPALMPVPGAAIDLMYGREFGQTIKGGQRVMPRRTLDLGYRFRHPELEDALRDLLARDGA